MSNAPTINTADIWVCEDCYFALHYGVTEHDGTYDREPLNKVADGSVTDNTCSNHRHGQDDDRDDEGTYTTPCDHCGSSDDENGIDAFSSRSCQGCGSNLGGSRYRLNYEWITAA